MEKLTLLLQFMDSREVMRMEPQLFHPATQLSIAHGFCLLVHLLQDKNSNVCARTQYCITGLKNSAVEVCACGYLCVLNM